MWNVGSSTRQNQLLFVIYVRMCSIHYIEEETLCAKFGTDHVIGGHPADEWMKLILLFRFSVIFVLFLGKVPSRNGSIDFRD